MAVFWQTFGNSGSILLKVFNTSNLLITFCVCHEYNTIWYSFNTKNVNEINKACMMSKQVCV